jgi:thiol-disulfide isomerase/thioredoxin
MKQRLIFAVMIFSFVFTACSNNTTKEESAANATEQQVSTDNNAAAARSANIPAEALPAFTIQDMAGKNVNLQSLKGKKVFVNLWASWCPPCRREMPSIEKLSKAVDQNKVAFVMLSLDDNFDKAKAFVKRERLSLPIYYPAESLPEMFNVQGIPTTFIFDESGKLIQRIDGGDIYDSQEYRKLLQ